MQTFINWGQVSELRQTVQHLRKEIMLLMSASIIGWWLLCWVTMITNGTFYQHFISFHQPHVCFSQISLPFLMFRHFSLWAAFKRKIRKEKNCPPNWKKQICMYLVCQDESYLSSFSNSSYFVSLSHSALLSFSITRNHNFINVWKFVNTISFKY